MSLFTSVGSFLFITEWISIKGIHQNLLLYLPAKRRLSWFQFGGIFINKVAMNVCATVFVWDASFLWKTPKVGMAGSCG